MQFQNRELKETYRKLKKPEDHKSVIINFRILDRGHRGWIVLKLHQDPLHDQDPCQCAMWDSWGLTMGRLVCASGTGNDESRPRSSILKVHTSEERGHERYRGGI